MSSTSNSTSHLNPFNAEIALAIPRFLSAVGSFALITVPEKLDNIIHGGDSVVAEATGNSTRHILSAALSGQTAASQASNTAARLSGGGEAVATMQGELTSSGPLTLQQIRNFGGVFVYMTSKWALVCFALVSVQFVKPPVR